MLWREALAKVPRTAPKGKPTIELYSEVQLKKEFSGTIIIPEGTIGIVVEVEHDFVAVSFGESGNTIGFHGDMIEKYLEPVSNNLSDQQDSYKKREEGFNAYEKRRQERENINVEDKVKLLKSFNILQWHEELMPVGSIGTVNIVEDRTFIAEFPIPNSEMSYAKEFDRSDLGWSVVKI